MKINLTRKSDDKVIEIDASQIDYLKPKLFECEIYFVDGSSVQVNETDKVIGKLIRDARK